MRVVQRMGGDIGDHVGVVSEAEEPAFDSNDCC